ncbi:MAG: hypothetical protein Fur0010_25710 [Bdellovibrio sp.]
MTIVDSYFSEWLADRNCLQKMHKSLTTIEIKKQDRMPLNLSSTGIQIVSMVTMIKEFIDAAMNGYKREVVFKKYTGIERLIITHAEAIREKGYIQNCLKKIIEQRKSTILIHREEAHVIKEFLESQLGLKESVKIP